MTAITDLWLGLGYVLGPAIAYLFRGDRKPTPTERNEHERL